MFGDHLSVCCGNFVGGSLVEIEIGIGIGIGIEIEKVLGL
jgi:hypothetical protein